MNDQNFVLVNLNHPYYSKYIYPPDDRERSILTNAELDKIDWILLQMVKIDWTVNFDRCQAGQN